eukprot:6179183-Pleurochrysis_carterae.AAC.1
MSSSHCRRYSCEESQVGCETESESRVKEEGFGPSVETEVLPVKTGSNAWLRGADASDGRRRPAGGRLGGPLERGGRGGRVQQRL